MNSSYSRAATWTIWMIASVFYAYQYILRVMPNIMIDDIMQQFNIGEAAFGQFSGVYYIGYSLMHIPIGMMLDRFGPKKIMSGCILMTVAGILPLIFAEHWTFPIAGRFLIGMGSSAAILGVFKIIRMTFDEKRFPRMLSLSVTIGLIGAIWGGGPVSYLFEVFGYHAVVKLFALMGVLLAALTYWTLPNVTSAVSTTAFSDIKQVLSNKKVVFSCLFAGLMVGPLEGFADVWGTAFLKIVYGFEGTVAASLPSMIFIGMCFGSPVLSFIADKSGSYLATIVGAGMVMALSFFGLLNWQMTSGAISTSFVIVGVCSAYQILAIYKASTYVPEHVAGLTTAVANMIIMTFGYLFHSVIGVIVNVTDSLAFGIAVIPIALVIGSAGFGVLWAMEAKSSTAKEF